MKKNAICLKLFWYNVFVHRKLKLVNFLVNVNLKTIWVRVCTVSEWSRYATVFCRWEHENVLRMLLNIKCVGVIIRIKYAPKLGYTPPLIKQNLFSNPPHIMIILRLTSPPLTLEKSLLQLIPSYLVSTCWISFSGTNITSNDSSTYVKEWSESLDSELVSSWHELGDSSSSTASLALRFPHAWVKSSI